MANNKFILVLFVFAGVFAVGYTDSCDLDCSPGDVCTVDSLTGPYCSPYACDLDCSPGDVCVHDSLTGPYCSPFACDLDCSPGDVCVHDLQTGPYCSPFENDDDADDNENVESRFSAKHLIFPAFGVLFLIAVSLLVIIGIIIIVYLKRKLKHRSRTLSKVNIAIQEQGEQRLAGSLQDPIYKLGLRS